MECLRIDPHPTVRSPTSLGSRRRCLIYFSDNEKIEKIATSIGAKLNPRDVRHTDPHVPLQLLFQQWLPVASAVFGSLAASAKCLSLSLFVRRHGR